MTAAVQQEFRLPDLGEGVHEGRIIRLHVVAGQSVNEDEPLMEVETDKAAVEIPSPVTGIVTTVHIESGQLVHVGDVMITFDGDSGAPPDAARETPMATASAAATSVSATTPSATSPTRRKPASPSVRRMARELGLSVQDIAGSGPGGRITRADVERASNTPAAESPMPTAAAVVPATATPTPIGTPQPPLHSVTTPGMELEGQRDQDAYGEIVRQDLSQARKTIAQVMQISWQTIPHVTDCNDADITNLEEMRRGFVDPERPDRKVTTLAFVIRAICRALLRHPILNATIDTDRQEVVYRQYINIGIGVETPRGLVAPVIRNAHLMGAGDIADHLAVITHNARSGQFGVEDTRGATYVISNAGAMGRTRYSTPIIMPGTVACLAVGRARKMPWVVDDEIVPRIILPLSHSMDHRLVDGGREIPFIEHLIDDLEHPMRFAL
ncbi:MAG: 2-oxo acid dehydrogenase subunit E2 [Phycisphaerales bacterium]|nr:2-oxo acid dehydrogenase subunit E2 [Phycisphaerales bacterium]